MMEIGSVPRWMLSMVLLFLAVTPQIHGLAINYCSSDNTGGNLQPRKSVKTTYSLVTNRIQCLISTCRMDDAATTARHWAISTPLSNTKAAGVPITSPQSKSAPTAATLHVPALDMNGVVRPPPACTDTIRSILELLPEPLVALLVLPLPLRLVRY